MKDDRTRCRKKIGWLWVLAGALVVVSVVPTDAVALTLQIAVTDPSGTPVSGFRWLVEEDNTNQPLLGVPVSNSLAVDIHKSHAPVVAAGHTEAAAASVDVPGDMPYFVSVLPDSGHTLGGARAALGESSVTVIVNPYPVPTSQISVLAFHDNALINTTPDFPIEQGLPGFSVVIADSAGQQMMDAMGNPLGTTYTVDQDGVVQVDQMGDGVILTNQFGEALIENLPPGKYAVEVIPPAGEGWIQTTTIEGTKVIDAWVGAGNPSLLVEFGPGFHHIFAGFVQEFNELDTLAQPDEPTGTITGRVAYDHVSRPPRVQGFFPGPPVLDAYVGLNHPSSQRGVYFAPCDPDDGSFTITGIPAGTYQLVTTDKHLDSIFGFQTVIIPDMTDPENPNWNLDLTDPGVLAFPWYSTLFGSVFYDDDEDGFRDPGESGMPGQEVLLRFRNGIIYQATATDVFGNYSFTEVFPFFKWLVAEVGFLTLKDTGHTNVVDYGGEIPPDQGWDMPSFGVLNPQPQLDPDGVPIINPNTGNEFSRTECCDSPGAFLLQALLGFAGQSNFVDWGKVDYGPGENGGIAGLVYYAVTRAEDDPAYAAAEEWEPGIPRVQINLYQDANFDAVIDDLNGDGGPTRSDVDNYPLGWIDDPNNPEAKGLEDVDWDGDNVFDPGDAVQIGRTDSWDDSLPTGCIQDLPIIHGEEAAECYDNFGTWNQLRPGVFDGGFAITSYFPLGMEGEAGGIDPPAPEEEPLGPGFYIVEAPAPPGYETLKEEDKNVDYGDEYIPAGRALPPPCVGEDHLVPEYLTLFGDIEAPFAGEWRPLCDLKRVWVSSGQNTGVEYFMFTDVPKAARAVGVINNDLAAEANPDSPLFGEKQAPSWIPIAFRDYAGNEITRIYSDEFGAYNALLPSTYTVNIAAPSGVSPHMVTFTLNDPGPVPDPNNPGQTILDPYFDPSYSQTSYTFNFAAGAVTYLDTPVVPVAAFVGYPDRAVDAEPVDGTPMIHSVMGPSGGPLVCADREVITITSLGQTSVPNPYYDPQDPNSEQLITRDYGFGTQQGEVTVNDAQQGLNILSWSNDSIQVRVRTNRVSTGQLMVTRADNGLTTPIGITLHVEDCGNVVHVTGGSTYPDTPIQDAIEAAAPGTLIVVEPGTYEENLIIWKNVRVQGSGAGSTIINGRPLPAARVTNWHTKIAELIASGDLVPLDPEGAGRFFAAVEAPAVFVHGKPETFDENSPGLIDGLTVMGAVAGGGIYAAAHADYLQVSNNRVTNNQGNFGGGITAGTTNITFGFAGDPDIDSFNDFISIHHNMVVKNGGIRGGGGITLMTGADNYTAADNIVIGNFTRFAGAGVAHWGLSDGGTIARNRIAFNEVFYGGEIGGDGGGILIAGIGADPREPALGVGSGSVTMDANLVQGNLAGSGSGGGIRAINVNGEDVQNAPDDPGSWYSLNIFNNMVVNNVAAFRGGGIALSDAARVNIIHNTIAANDSTGTAALAFPAGNLLQSNPQGAGVVSTPHSPQLATASGQSFANPQFVDNIVWHNRSFYWDGTLNDFVGDFVPNTPPYWDLQVVGGGALDPQYCVLSDTTGYAPSNISDDPRFEDPYNNTLRGAALVEEGGNFVTVRYLELAITGDYHIRANSSARNEGLDGFTGEFPALAEDFDGESRPQGANPDIGADERYGGGGEPLLADPLILQPQPLEVSTEGGETFQAR